MTAISNIVCIHKLDNIVNKYNNTYHITIKMKPVDAKSNTYIGSSKEINNPKFKNCSYCQNIKIKRYTPNSSEDVFVTKKVKRHCAMDIGS